MSSLRQTMSVDVVVDVWCVIFSKLPVKEALRLTRVRSLEAASLTTLMRTFMQRMFCKTQNFGNGQTQDERVSQNPFQLFDRKSDVSS